MKTILLYACMVHGYLIAYCQQVPNLTEQRHFGSNATPSFYSILQAAGSANGFVCSAFHSHTYSALETFDLGLGSNAEWHTFIPTTPSFTNHFTLYRAHHGETLSEIHGAVVYRRLLPGAVTNITANYSTASLYYDRLLLDLTMGSLTEAWINNDLNFVSSSPAFHKSVLTVLDSFATPLYTREVLHKPGAFRRTIPNTGMNGILLGMLDENYFVADYSFRDSITHIVNEDTVSMYSADWLHIIELRSANDLLHIGVLEGTGKLAPLKQYIYYDRVYRAYAIRGSFNLGTIAGDLVYQTPENEDHLVMVCYAPSGDVLWYATLGIAQNCLGSTGATFKYDIESTANALVISIGCGIGYQTSGMPDCQFTAYHGDLTLDGGELQTGIDNAQAHSPRYVYVLDPEIGFLHAACRITNINPSITYGAPLQNFSQPYYWDGHQIVILQPALSSLGPASETYFKKIFPEEGQECTMNPSQASLSYRALYIDAENLDYGIAFHLPFQWPTVPAGGVLLAPVLFETNKLLLAGNYRRQMSVVFPDTTLELFTGSWNANDYLGLGLYMEIASELSSNFNYSDKAKITIYPNPAAQEIQLLGTNHYPIRFNIFDISGKEMAEGQLRERAITINHLPQGMYILQLEMGYQDTIRIRFIKI